MRWLGKLWQAIMILGGSSLDAVLDSVESSDMTSLSPPRRRVWPAVTALSEQLYRLPDCDKLWTMAWHDLSWILVAEVSATQAQCTMVINTISNLHMETRQLVELT